jgi:hypothetical protein
MNEETEKRTSIADLTTKRLEKISKEDPGKLTRIWHSTSDDPEKRQKLAANLGAKQRNMVQGGNIEAIKYAAKHSDLPTTAGVALGVGLRAAFEKMRGTKEVKPKELKGSVPSIQAKQGLQSDKVGNETPWGPRPEAKMKNTIKESFKHRLQEKREKNIEEEGAWDATKAAAAGAARELSFGLSDKAIDALGGKEERERLAKEHPTATKVGEYGSYAIPFGAGLSLAKGAYAGGKAALKGAELLGKTGMGAKAVAAARGAAAGAGKTLPGRAIKGIGRGVKGAAKGAAALGALAVSGGGGSDSGSASAPGGDFRSIVGQYDFGKSLTGVTIGKSNQTPYGGDPLANIAQRKAFGVNEQTNFNKIRILSENKDAEAELVFEDSSVTVNGRIAKKIMNIHESLNKRNKKKVEKMINEDITSLTKVINFSVRQ